MIRCDCGLPTAGPGSYREHAQACPVAVATMAAYRQARAAGASARTAESAAQRVARDLRARQAQP